MGQPSKKHRAIVFERDGGKCRECGCKLSPDNWDCDHMHQKATGGDDHPDNYRALCKPCHTVKSRKDAKVRAKIKRLRGETKQGPKAKIQNRGWDTRYRKKFNGTVERRTD